MARLNLLNLHFGARTHEGAPARNISAELQLRRSVLACLLWETQFYEDGVEIAGRIAELVPKVAVEKVSALAVEAREKMKLRHAPLLLVREMARLVTHRQLVAETLFRVVQRVDELGVAPQRIADDATRAQEVAGPFGGAGGVAEGHRQGCRARGGRAAIRWGREGLPSDG